MSFRTIARLVLVVAVVISGMVRLANAQAVDFSLKVAPTVGTLSDEYVATVQINLRGINAPERFWPPEFGDFTVLDQRTQQSTQAAVAVSPEVGERDAVARGDEGGGEVAPGGAQVAHAGDAHDERAGARYLVGDGTAVDGDHIQ